MNYNSHPQAGNSKRLDLLAALVAGVRPQPTPDDFASKGVTLDPSNRTITLDGRYGSAAVWVYDGSVAVLLHHGESLHVCGERVLVYPCDQDRTSVAWLWLSADGPVQVPPRYLYKSITGSIVQGTWSFGGIHLAVDTRAKTVVEARNKGGADVTLKWEYVSDPGDGSAPTHTADGTAVVAAGTIARVPIASADGVQFLALSADGNLTVRIVQAVTP